MHKRAAVATFALMVMAGCARSPSPSISPGPTLSQASPSPAATSSPTATATRDAWAGLFRTLKLPSLEPGEACPATASTATLANIGPVVGDGPIYPAFLGPDGVFSLGLDGSGNEPIRIGIQDWWGKKTLWLSDDSYDGIALVRGGRIDQPGEVLFYPGSGPDYVAAMRLTEHAWVSGGAPAGWREWNSGVFYAEPGCYAFQVDGEDFTDIIVVEATR
jgi:hypothetical protein